jgi:hypothetical protein
VHGYPLERSASFTSPARSHRSRGDAWLAICNLTQLAQSNPKSADVRTMLERAIAHVKLWQAALTALG